MVSIRSPLMDWTVDVNHQGGPDAVEIDNETSHSVLAAKFEPIESASPDLLPKAVLSGSWPAPHSNCFVSQVGPDRAERNFP